MINAKKEKVKNRFGDYFDSLVIYGNTISIKSELSAMGFKWYSPKYSWWKPYNSVLPDQFEKLKKLGVIFEGDQVTQQNKEEAKIGEETQKSTKEKKQWVTEDPDMTKWYGFPINKNIYSYSEICNADGKDYKVNISIDRSFVLSEDPYKKTKSREYKGKPKYIINIEVPEVDYKGSYKEISKELWGSYDEESYIETKLKELITKALIENKIKKIIEFKNEINKRTPEYKKFLNNLGQLKKGSFPIFDFVIDDKDNQEYSGLYQVAVDGLGVDESATSVYIRTHVTKEGAPRDATVSYKASILKTYTIDDFNRKINEHLIESHDEIQKNYIKYLKSFPYLANQLSEANKKVEELKDIMKSPESNTEKIFNEIKARGYIRPHKRQKQGLGLTSGEEIKWIVDSKKIVKDAYSGSSYLGNSPDYFYAVIAYYVHRRVRNIQSWTDMMLRDSMSNWRTNMEKFGVNISFKEVDYIVTKIGEEIYKSLKGDFEPEKEEIVSNVPRTLKEFADFAKKHGISTDDLENNIKAIYRSLVKNLHPDTVLDQKEKEIKEEEFKKLQKIYDEIPQQYKQALSWYDKYVESESRKFLIVNSFKK